MGAYAGRKGVIYISVTGTGAATSIVNMKTWSLNMPTDKIEVTAFGDLNKQYVQGLPDVKGTLSGFFDSADDALFDASESSDGCKLYLYPSSLATSIYHFGPAWLDASMDVDAKGAVTITGSFVANGSWGRRP